MRAAIIVSGNPRFCEEFDLFLENLKDYDEVDWFFQLWKDSPPVDSYGYDLVAPCWQQIDHTYASTRLREFLPADHNIVAIEIGDRDEVPSPEITHTDGATLVKNIWAMWYGIYRADLLRRQHEEQIGKKYDLVIRTRADVGLMNPISLRDIGNHLKADPRLLIQPSNKICGYGPVICDLFAITTSDNMTLYSNILNLAKGYHDRGWIFHPETMLAKHVMEMGMHCRSFPFNIEFRYLGKWSDPKTGELTRQTVGTYQSKYGRWA